MEPGSSGSTARLGKLRLHYSGRPLHTESVPHVESGPHLLRPLWCGGGAKDALFRDAGDWPPRRGPQGSDLALQSGVGVCWVGGSPMNECPGSALFSFLWEQCSLIQLDLLVGVQVRVALSM